MAYTYQTGFTTTLAAKLAAGDTTATLATVPTRTSGRMLIRAGSIKEWISYTGVSGSTITGLTRGLSQTANPATSGTGLTWVAGTQISLVAMHDQLMDRQEGVFFDSTTIAGLRANSLTTTQRNALTAANGDIIYNSTAGEFQIYQGGAWSTMSSGSTQPNGSETVAGKYETATEAEGLAGTDTGGTGASLVMLPSRIAANVQSNAYNSGTDAGGDDTYVVAYTPAMTAAYTTGGMYKAKLTTANTGACTIDFGPGVKNIKLPDGTDPLTGDILANSVQTFMYDGTNMVLIPLIQRASTSDATTGTDTVKMMTPVATQAAIEDSVGATSQFASSSSNSYDTGDQTAATALWVTVNLDSSGAGSRAYATCNVGSASPSALIGRVSTDNDNNVNYNAFSFPVKKGYHWQVVITGTGSTNTTYIRTTPIA